MKGGVYRMLTFFRYSNPGVGHIKMNGIRFLHVATKAYFT